MMCAIAGTINPLTPPIDVSNIANGITDQPGYSPTTKLHSTAQKAAMIIGAVTSCAANVSSQNLNDS